MTTWDLVCAFTSGTSTGQWNGGIEVGCFLLFRTANYKGQPYREHHPCIPSEVWISQRNFETMLEQSKGSESVWSEHLLSLWARPTHGNSAFPFPLQNNEYKHITNPKHESTLKLTGEAQYEFRRQEGSPRRSVLHIQLHKIHWHTRTRLFPTLDHPGWHKTILTNGKQTDTSFLYLCLSCIWGSTSFRLYWLFSAHRPGRVSPGFAASTATGTPSVASKLEPWGDPLHPSVQSCPELHNQKHTRVGLYQDFPAKLLFLLTPWEGRCAFCACTLPVSLGAGKKILFYIIKFLKKQGSATMHQGVHWESSRFGARGSVT